MYFVKTNISWWKQTFPDENKHFLVNKHILYILELLSVIQYYWSHMLSIHDIVMAFNKMSLLHNQTPTHYQTMVYIAMMENPY